MIPEVEAEIAKLKLFMEVVIDNSRGHYKRRIEAMYAGLLDIEHLVLQLTRGNQHETKE